MTRTDAALPLYEQVRRVLLSEIEAGTPPVGGFLPPEAELCARFDVSRITLRRAIGELCAAGHLSRQQGRGTVVLPGKMRQRLVSLSGFSETLGDLGRRAHHRILSRDDTPGDGDVASLLSAASLVRFERLLCDEDRPVTLETLWFDAGRFPGVAEPVAAGGSFFAALRDHAGIRPARAERQINAGFASAAETAILGGSAGRPVFRIEKLVSDAEGRPVALSRLVTPCDLVTYVVTSDG